MQILITNTKSSNIDKEDVALVSSKYEISNTNIGRGADWIGIVVNFLAEAIEVGKVISSSLAYVQLYERAKKFLKKQTNPYFIDIDLATLRCFEEIDNDIGVCDSYRVILKENISQINTKDAFLDDRPEWRLDSKPFGFYVISIVVEKDSECYTYLFCIKSDNTIKYKSKFMNDDFKFPEF